MGDGATKTANSNKVIANYRNASHDRHRRSHSYYLPRNVFGEPWRFLQAAEMDAPARGAAREGLKVADAVRLSAICNLIHAKRKQGLGAPVHLI